MVMIFTGKNAFVCINDNNINDDGDYDDDD